MQITKFQAGDMSGEAQPKRVYFRRLQGSSLSIRGREVKRNPESEACTGRRMLRSVRPAVPPVSFCCYVLDPCTLNWDTYASMAISIMTYIELVKISIHSALVANIFGDRYFLTYVKLIYGSS